MRCRGVSSKRPFQYSLMFIVETTGAVGHPRGGGAGGLPVVDQSNGFSAVLF